MQSEENTNPTSSTHYKYRNMKVYSSDEWMADGTKKYRKVFDRYETTYMRIEFSFFNKLFDEQEWEAHIRIKCFQDKNNQKVELCNLEEKRKISKDENIVYVRQSWGNATPGAYWFRGHYIWEGYIDEVKIGEAKFYVEDAGQPVNEVNPFFEIESIKLFEGDGKASELTQKKYLKKFSQKDTRYVWAEFCFKNKTSVGYLAEIFFNFYDRAGQPKGSNDYLTYVAYDTPGKVYTIFPGWGGESPGRWNSDSYTLEVVFMDRLLATVPFLVGDEVEEGEAPVIIGTAPMVKASSQAVNVAIKKPEDLLYESLDELNSLTGLTQIKTEVNEMVQLVRFYQETGKEFLNKFSLHTVFTGNPGTGKTTVARILSRIYKGLGILEKGHLVEVDREGLVAGYVGQTAIKTSDKINEAMGGVLFIDEAYSLARESGAQHDFGGEAIQIILKRMEDLRGKFGVIVAGYTENMHEFIQSNPGLRSRFDKYFEFPDYSPEEMYTIAKVLFGKEGVKLEEAATNHLKNYFNFLFDNRDKHFGNARSVRQIVGESVKNQHLRLASMKKEHRSAEVMELILLDDVKEFEIKENRGNRKKLGFQLGND